MLDSYHLQWLQTLKSNNTTCLENGILSGGALNEKGQFGNRKSGWCKEVLSKKWSVLSRAWDVDHSRCQEVKGFFSKLSLSAWLYPRHDDGLIEGERMDYGELVALHGCQVVVAYEVVYQRWRMNFGLMKYPIYMQGISWGGEWMNSRTETTQANQLESHYRRWKNEWRQ